MRVYYRICRFICQCFCTVYFKARVFGVRNVPATGGVLLVSNHQSFMDPVLATMALHREGNYMARDSLFRHPVFRRLIESLNAFPVKRNAADVGAIKESLRRLKQGKVVLLFPEGTRTEDGRIGAMLPGVGAIAMKARVPIVPTLIDGVFQTWPKGQLLPSAGDVIVEYGCPLTMDDYAGMSPEELMDAIRGRLLAMQACWHGRVPSRRLKWYDGAGESTMQQAGQAPAGDTAKPPADGADALEPAGLLH